MMRTKLVKGQALLVNGLSEIPEKYKAPAEHQGRMDTLLYSVGKKTKKALVYVPYCYSADQQYNILIILYTCYNVSLQYSA